MDKAEEFKQWFVSQKISKENEESLEVDNP
jgi:hypothetical protein